MAILITSFVPLLLYYKQEAQICVVFLLLPQFFSKRGRQALMAYAFILAITGPAKNTLQNMGILSQSLACGQEQLKSAVRQIVEAIKKPFYAIRDAIRTVVKSIKVIVKKIKDVLLRIKRIVLTIVRVIKAAFQFLGKILNICNKELGTPFQRCMRVFEEAILDCNAKLGPLFSWLCSITYLVQSVCYIVKIFDFICMLVDFISDSIVGVVIKKIKTFVRHIKTMFYVKLKFSRSFAFETTQSKSVSEVAEGIITEVRERTENLLAVFDFMSCATSLFFLFIVVRVLHYRYKFLTSDRFDNHFITRDLRNIDIRRAQMEKETILPLNHRERALYINVNSIRLVKIEKLKLSKAAVALCVITLKLSTHMMADYALYWVLMTIRTYARFQSKMEAPNVIGLHIDGNGFIANLLKGIVTAFQPIGLNLEIDTIPCLPDPIPPDYDRYIQIASLVLLCWILTIFEPYGLRLRHSVMCYYHPTRARERSIWLYNHIMRSRSSFLKFARRQLRRKVIGSRKITKITCIEFLRANINSKYLRFCLGSDEQIACILCGEVFRDTTAIRCEKQSCPGIYCEQCFSDLRNLCTVCMEPIQYGDLSDISEERDSSDGLQRHSFTEKFKRKKKYRSRCITYNISESDSDDDHGLTSIKRRTIDDLSEHSFAHSENENESDNSYSYQQERNLSSQSQESKIFQFRDVEVQKIPSYASRDDSLNEVPSDVELPEEMKCANTTPAEGVLQNFKISFSRFYTMINGKLHDFQNFIRMKHIESELVSCRCDDSEPVIREDVSSETGSPVAYGSVKSASMMCDYFKHKVKHETMNESTKSLASSTVSPSTSSSSSVLSTQSMTYDVSPNSLQSTRGPLDQLKNIERKRRVEEVIKSNKENFVMRSNDTLERMDANTELSQLLASNKDVPRYRQRLIDYCRPVKKWLDSKPLVQSDIKPASRLKMLFGKRKPVPRVKKPLESGETLVLLSPRSINVTSDTQESRFLSSDTSNEGITYSDLKTSSHMASTRNYTQEGVDRKINFESNWQTVDIESTDSELSDVDIFFGKSNKKIRRAIKLNNDADSKRETSIIEERKEENFWRQSAERDETPSIIKSNAVFKHNPTQGTTAQQQHFDKMSDNDNLSDISARSPGGDEYDNPNIHNPKFLLKNYPHNINKCFHTDKAHSSNCCRKCLKNQRRSFNGTRQTSYDPATLLQRKTHPRQKEEVRCTCKSQPLSYNCPKHEKNMSHKLNIFPEDCGDDNIHTYTRIKQKHNYKNSPPPPRLTIQYQDDQCSCCSDYSGHSEFPELVYQHTEEFLDLVNELGDTLSLRNKNRVETTIREFEYLSKHNKNLEKPIFGEDTEDDSRQRSPRQEACFCDCSRRISRKDQPICCNKYHANDQDIIRVRTQYAPHNECSRMYKKPKSVPCYQRTYNSRWQRDGRTGKWYRVCSDDAEDNGCLHDYSKSLYFPPQPPPPPPLPSSTFVTCERNRRYNGRHNSKYREEDRKRSSRTCKCCNCTQTQDA
ncbi:uncharacterized protein LOC116171003 isoform X2 [Photinus pyralis]|uniref:uncharacterized protein LOC116171003 isoform X2 n=1 Tax=Photinus pyralis TaxID=7054 RepID=UPI0012674432|nr:uncharacterized protein LOC116171003 isoform X2 [Photinus pyralis]